MQIKDVLDKTYKEIIKEFFKPKDTYLTCANICTKIQKKYKLSKEDCRYMSGTVSGILRKMVMIDEYLDYEPKLSGPRGGYVYKLNRDRK